MLELRNLTKVYKTKGGDVRALDGIDLIFPETGMIFLLGKSGSGKSTLLNVCGGLDDPTSGEIIVRGRSSDTFSGSDFDSYRNTFIGFIFQEYNVLNEFSVEDNLSIALELQGKPKDKEKVAELLRQVDMVGYAKRKPNTLSGGQKQRIAIARALIKDPKIIMADEPTGALDSATGKQVFDTLKSLSKDRLVIVVSHDRDFAEYYGDRIIELKDGKVISDVTKERVAPKAVSENVVLLNENTLSVKKGEKLDENDLKKINEFLKSGEGDLIISKGKENVEAFKKANRIGIDGSSESFAATDKEKIEAKKYGKEDCKFVRSRLPLGKAIKMGASSLKVKPFRLVLTIILSVAAFVFFGIVSTMMNYNEKLVVAESFNKSTYNAVKMGKVFRYVYEYYNGDELLSKYEQSNGVVMTEKDVDILNAKIGDKVVPYFTFSSGAMNVRNLSAKSDTSRALMDFSLTGFAPFSKAPDSFPIKVGRAPSSPYEIAISDFYAKVMASNEYYEYKAGDRIEKVTINGDNEVIGRHLYVVVNGREVDLIIVGVFDGGGIPAEYDGYDSAEDFLKWDYTKQRTFVWFIDETLEKVVAVSDDFYAKVAEDTNYSYTFRTGFGNDYYKYFANGDYLDYRIPGFYENYFYINGYAFLGGSDDTLPVYFFGEERSTLSDDEMIVEMNALPRFSLTDEELDEWKSSHASYSEKSEEAYRRASDLSEDYAAAGYWTKKGDIYAAAYSYPSNMIDAIRMRLDDRYYTDALAITQEELIEYAALLTEFYSGVYTAKQMNVTLEYYSDIGIKDSYASMTIVGFYFDPNTPEQTYEQGVYVSENFYNNVVYEKEWREVFTTNFVFEEADVYYDGAFVPFGSGKKDNINKVVGLLDKYADDDSGYSINNSLYMSISSIGYVIQELLKVFLILGSIFAVFAALLLFNFITVSISNKMHEIGVLRAVGARGTDVFKIFFSESFIISAICVALAVVGTILSLIPLNASITKALTFTLQLFVFGPISLLMLIGVALVVALLGTLLPVIRISRKKPVDSMKG